jgi:hypothetical protein
MLQAVYFCSGTVAEEDFKHYGLVGEPFNLTPSIRSLQSPSILSNCIALPKSLAYPEVEPSWRGTILVWYRRGFGAS